MRRVVPGHTGVPGERALVARPAGLGNVTGRGPRAGICAHSPAVVQRVHGNRLTDPIVSALLAAAGPAPPGTAPSRHNVCFDCTLPLAWPFGAPFFRCPNCAGPHFTTPHILPPLPPPPLPLPNPDGVHSPTHPLPPAVTIADHRYTTIRCFHTDSTGSGPATATLCRLNFPIITLPHDIMAYARRLALLRLTRLLPPSARIHEGDVATALLRHHLSGAPWPTPPSSFPGKDHRFLHNDEPTGPGLCYPASLPNSYPAPLWDAATSAYTPVARPHGAPLKAAAHASLLVSHPLGEWLHASICFGFTLLSNTPTSPRDAPNVLRGPPSAPSHQAAKSAAKVEMDEGAWIRWPRAAPLTQARYAPFFAIPKPNGTLRGITDLSWGPASVNECVRRTTFLRPRLADLPSILQRIQYMRTCRPDEPILLAKVDARRAFRMCPCPVRDYRNAVYQFGQRSYADTRLIMGSASSADTMGQCIAAMSDVLYRNHGIWSTAYADDQMFITYADCADSTRATIISMWTALGWPLNETKALTDGIPATTKTFLGICVNTTTMTVGIDGDRRTKLLDTINTILSGTDSPTPQQYSSLAGKLRFVADVIPLGITFLRSLYARGTAGKLCDAQEVGVPADVRADLEWWQLAITLFDGVASFSPALPVPELHVWTDASGAGFGGYCPVTSECFAGPWRRAERQATTTAAWEMAAIVMAVSLWAPLFPGGRLVVHTDSMACHWAFTRRRARDPVIHGLMRVCALLQIEYKCLVVTIHTPGEDNPVADFLSRHFRPPASCPHLRPLTLPPTIRSSLWTSVCNARWGPSPAQPLLPRHAATGTNTAHTPITASRITLPWTHWNTTPQVAPPTAASSTSPGGCTTATPPFPPTQ